MGYWFSSKEGMLTLTDDYKFNPKIVSVTINGQRFIPETPAVPTFEVGDIVQLRKDVEGGVGPRPGQYGQVSHIYNYGYDVDFGSLIEHGIDGHTWSFNSLGDEILSYSPSTRLLTKVGHITEEAT